MTDYIVSAAVVRARDELAERRVFPLSESDWELFQAVLERPPVHKPRLARLMADDAT